jgi:type III restriction enzyme
MRLTLKDFQETAVEDLAKKVRFATEGAARVGPQAVILSAPTGSGKTVIMTALIERILQGDDTADPDPDAIFLWLTDLPELNEQTREKMAATSNVLNAAFTLRMIDSAFDQPRLDDGKVYFLNTQKLGKDKLLTQRGDGRTHTIWEIIDRTIADKGGHFYVVIDEAHRGMRTKREETEAKTIIQRFLVGTDEMAPSPVVIGVSATPKRFDLLLEGLDRTKQRHEVDVAAVRASGLLKDRIVLHHLADDQQADMTMLQEAAREWAGFGARWATYAGVEGAEPVEPILVVQVEDAPKGRKGTATPLDQAIDTINGVLPALLPAEAFAHSFDDGAALDSGSRTIRYLKPSQVARDRSVKVVFFKTALSTGWDCPQAEVMMSFRKAVDATYIAQLIGRMVRTPLARRVERDETLNSVALFLPHYNAEGVAKVIGRLQDPEHEYVPPVDIETAADSQVLEPVAGSEAMLAALRKTPSYLVPSARPAKQTIRVMRFVRALARDQIDPGAHDAAQGQLIGHLRTATEERRKDKVFRALAEGKGKITIGEIVYDPATGEAQSRGSRDVEATAKNVNDLFAEAGRRVGEGLHTALWESLCDGVDDLAAIRANKIQAAVMLSNAAVVKEVEALAESLVVTLYRQHVDAIDVLPEERRAVYRELLGGARQPVETTLRVRDRIVLPKRGGAFPKHLYVDARGNFHADLNNWERAAIKAELARGDVIGWLRNVDRKDWALQVPYRDGKGIYRPLYPDFLVFRQAGGKVIVDILDPHESGLQDAVHKAKGLAEFAADHGVRFGRIELIIMEGDTLLRLDLTDKATREDLKVVDSPEALRHLYESQRRQARP